MNLRLTRTEIIKVIVKYPPHIELEKTVHAPRVEMRMFKELDTGRPA